MYCKIINKDKEMEQAVFGHKNYAGIHWISFI